MQFVFEAYMFEPHEAHPRLLQKVIEACPIEQVPRRASQILWSLPLHEIQDLVVVRRESDGVEVFRKATGTSRHTFTHADLRGAKRNGRPRPRG